MALSDVLYDTGLDIGEGALSYANRYDPDCIQQVSSLADFIKRCAGLVQEGYDLPKLPVVDSDDFIGIQRMYYEEEN